MAKPKANKAVEKKRQRVLVNFILDSSGSMDIVKTDTIGGFNQYIKTLKEDKGAVEYRFSLALFGVGNDSHTEIRHTDVPLPDVPALDEKTYMPSGMTPLYDAVGKMTTAVDATKADKVLTVIMTDGHENHSKEWALENVKDEKTGKILMRGVKELIKEKEALGNWTFVFLGSAPDAWDIGVGMGLSHRNTVSYTGSRPAAAMTATATATSNFAKSAHSNSRALYASLDSSVVRSAGLSVNDKDADEDPIGLPIGVTSAVPQFPASQKPADPQKDDWWASRKDTVWPTNKA